jgi:hypothetical protein
MVAKTLEDSMNSIFKFQAIWESQKIGCKWGEMLKVITDGKINTWKPSNIREWG